MATHFCGTSPVVTLLLHPTVPWLRLVLGLLLMLLSPGSATSVVPTYIFAPVGIRIMGAWGPKARKLIRKIGWRELEATGEPQSTSFLFQRLAIDVQRGNEASIMATIPFSQNWAEISNLPLVYAFMRTNFNFCYFTVFRLFNILYIFFQCLLCCILTFIHYC